MSLLFSELVLCAVLAGGAFAGLLALATTMTRRDAASRAFAFGPGAIAGLVGAVLALSSWFITGAAGEPLPLVVWLLIGALASTTAINLAGWLLATLAIRDRTAAPRMPAATGNELPGGN
jgi:hypothetical protein